MRTNKSASRAIDIIDLISRKKNAVTITEVSQTLDIPKSSAFELIYTLVEKGYIEIEDANLKTFNLGLKLFEAGAAFLENTDMHRESRPILEDVAARTGETVFLAVEDNGELVYLDKVEGSSLIRTTAKLGSRNPMHCTGLGKALLASYPIEKVEKIIKLKGMPRKTQYTITSLKDLLLELDEIKKRGYSMDNRESEMEVFCFAAPIYDRSNKPIAAVSIASLYSKIDDARLEQFGDIIVKTAMNISKRLGFTGDNLF